MDGRDRTPSRASPAGTVEESFSKMSEDEVPAGDTSTPPDSKLTDIDIKIADNGGFVVRLSYESTKRGKAGEPSMFFHSKTLPFVDSESLHEFLDDTLGTPDESEGNPDQAGAIADATAAGAGAGEE